MKEELQAICDKVLAQRMSLLLVLKIVLQNSQLHCTPVTRTAILKKHGEKVIGFQSDTFGSKTRTGFSVK